MDYSTNHGAAASGEPLGIGRVMHVVGWGFAWLVILLVAGTAAFAAEWSVLPSMAVKGYYNDNLLLTPLPHSATYGYWMSPAAQFSGKTGRLEVSGRAALDFVDYYGGQSTRFTNIFLPLTARYKTETDEWGFTGGFTRDNTLMSELLTTGLVLTFTQRNMWTANPTWTRNLTEKWAVQGAFQFTDTTYENGLRLGLVDYQVYGGSAGVIYHATERDDLQLSGTYTNFHTVNGAFGLRSSIPGALLSLNHIFTETIKGGVYGGPKFLSSTTQSGGATVTGRDTIWIYGANLIKQFEQASLQFSLARDIYPSGFGLLITTNRVGLLGTYNLSDTVTASLDTSGYIISSASSLATGRNVAENRLIYTTPKIAWQFSEWWRMEVSYSHRWRDAETLVEPVMSNSFMFMLTYFPPKLALSY